MPKRFSRRGFLKRSAAAGAAWTFAISDARRRILGANERLRLGVIGVGGRGAGNLSAVGSEQIVGLCDVDAGRLRAAARQHPGAASFVDWRELLEQPLDGVVVSTPDHQHAPPTARALRRGLPVYCEKPLTHTIEEARLLTRLAAEAGVATQMGTQYHEDPGYRRTVELIRAGAVGEVEEVHVVTDRPGGWWPQGLERPTAPREIPFEMWWDLWLGPAPDRPYDPAYAPFRWRGWWDFGCGAVGDMAIHLMDPAVWALGLGGRPVRVATEGSELMPESGPTRMKATFSFPAHGGRPAVRVHWYEGTAEVPEAVRAELPMNGSLFVGTEGRLAIAHASWKEPRLYPEERFKDYRGPEPSLPASPGHHAQWIAAVKEGTPTGSPFSYAGPFTELVLLANVAFRSGAPVEYDPDSMKVHGRWSAPALLTKSYREGWGLG